FQIEIKMRERVILDVAGSITQCLEFWQLVRGLLSAGNKAEAAGQRTLQLRISNRHLGIGFEGRRGDGHGHRVTLRCAFGCRPPGSPMGGSAVMPASTSAT